MVDFWQQLSGKNTVHQVSVQYNTQSSNTTESQSAPDLLFRFDETTDNVYGDSLALTTKEKKGNRNSDVDTININGQKFLGKTIIDNNGNTIFTGKSADGKTTYSATTNINGDVISYSKQIKKDDGTTQTEEFRKNDNISVTTKQTLNEKNEVVSSKTEEINENGTTEIKEFKQNKDSHVVSHKTIDENGKVTSSRTECVYTNGTTKGEFYEKYDDYYVRGNDTTYLDENGEKKYEYKSIFRDNYGNLLSSLTGNANPSTEIREQTSEKYSSGPVYRVNEKFIQRGEGTGLARTCNIKLQDGQECLDYSQDSIELSNDKQDKITMSTDELQAMTSVSIADREIKETDQFTSEPTITTPSSATCDEDIITNGGEISTEYADGTVKTEFYKIVDGKIIKGYTTVDKETGTILDDYRETYDENTQNLTSKEQIKYDDEAGKHIGRKETFTTPDGVTTVPNSCYYIQGVIGDTLRYTSGSYTESGTFTPDYSEDTVKFETMNKEYSVSSMQQILNFDKQFS